MGFLGRRKRGSRLYSLLKLYFVQKTSTHQALFRPKDDLNSE